MPVIERTTLFQLERSVSKLLHRPPPSQLGDGTSECARYTDEAFPRVRGEAHLPKSCGSANA